MASINDLPPELLVDIIASFAEQKSTIKSCRLVSRLWNELSSPHLITRVVFSRRFVDLVRLDAIVNHEHFRHCIKEIVFDASEYDSRLALNQDEYQTAKRISEEHGACDGEAQVGDDSEPTRNSHSQLKDVRQLYGVQEALSSHPSPASVLENFRVFDGHKFSAAIGRTTTFDAPDDSNERINYDQYSANWELQNQLTDSFQEDSTVANFIGRLPKLKKVVFTDWRHLARPGVSFHQFTANSFGGVLYPAMLLPKKSMYPRMTGVANHANVCSILQGLLLNALDQNPHISIEEFSTGSHIFEDEWDRTPSTNPRSLIYIPEEAIDSMGPVLKSIQRLHLAIAINDNRYLLTLPVMRDQTTTAFAEATALEHLTLILQPHLPVFPRLGKMAIYFTHWLSDQHYPRLATLDLRGFDFVRSRLENFLGAHAATLTTIHLINCQLIGDQPRLARWVNRHMKLTGVEIGSDREELYYWVSEDDDEYDLMKEGFVVDLDEADVDDETTEHPLPINMYPECEPVWMNYRPNRINRVIRTDQLGGTETNRADRTNWLHAESRSQPRSYDLPFT